MANVDRLSPWAVAHGGRPAFFGWIVQGVARTAFVAAATPLMWMVIVWAESWLAPAELPAGSHTSSSASATASLGDYVGWAAGFALYLGLTTLFAAMVGVCVGLVLGLVGAAVDAVSFRRIPPALTAVAITLAAWVAAISVSRAVGQDNWIVEDVGQLFLSSPFILGLTTLAVVPLARARDGGTRSGAELTDSQPAHRPSDNRTPSGAELTDRRGGARA